MTTTTDNTKTATASLTRRTYPNGFILTSITDKVSVKDVMQTLSGEDDFQNIMKQYPDLNTPLKIADYMSANVELNVSINLAFPFGHASQKQPKFKVGSKVNHKKTLYGETEGVIESVERIYLEVNRDGSFDRHGLATAESTMHHCCLPYEFDGETYSVHYPESTMNLSGGDKLFQAAKTRISKFYGYAYTVRTPKMLTQFSEGSLRLIKK